VHAFRIQKRGTKAKWHRLTGITNHDKIWMNIQILLLLASGSRKIWTG
jgi:predicted oxidoreductase